MLDFNWFHLVVNEKQTLNQHHIYNGGANKHVVTVFKIDRMETHTGQQTLESEYYGSVWFAFIADRHRSPEHLA